MQLLALVLLLLLLLLLFSMQASRREEATRLPENPATLEAKNTPVNSLPASEPAITDVASFWLTPPRYDEIKAFGTSAYAAMRQDSHWGFINTTGEEILPPQFDAIDETEHFSRAARLDKQWGVINTQGKWMVIPELMDLYGEEAMRKYTVHFYSEITHTDTGITAFIGKTLFLILVNAEGRVLTAPAMQVQAAYVVPHVQKNGQETWIYFHQKNGTVGFMDVNGRIIFSGKGNRLGRPVLSFSHLDQSDTSCRYVNMNTGRLMWKTYRFCGDFDVHSGLAVVNDHGRWGYLKTDGTWLVEPRFDNAYSFDGTGYAEAAENRRWGLIDTRGQWVIAPQYDSITHIFAHGKIIYCDEYGKDKCGLADASGSLDAPRFERYSVDGNRVIFTSTQKPGREIYFDVSSWRTVGEAEEHAYSRAQGKKNRYYSDENVDEVCPDGRVCGLQDKQGKIILPIAYRGLRFLYRDQNVLLFTAYQKPYWGILRITLPIK